MSLTSGSRPVGQSRPTPLHRLSSVLARGLPAPNPRARLEASMLSALGRQLDGLPVCVRLWDGRSWTGSYPPAATLRIADLSTLTRLLVDPDVTFGEGVTEGRIVVEGDALAFYTAMARRLADQPPRFPWRDLLVPKGTRQSAIQARSHYDLGNEFYRLWLDPQLVYTCAYFTTEDTSLAEAQVAKMDLVARKLHLRPGETVYEAGGGWGALALHLARRCDVRVRSWNVSRQQVAWARARAAREGLADRVEFVEGDYRAITGACDAFVSVGMVEHVGRRQLRGLGDVIHRTLHPRHGRGLLHFIGRSASAPMGRWIRRWVFPGAYLPTVAEVAANVLEPGTLAVMDLENLRPHYARTLELWRSAFDGVADVVRARHGERFERRWRLYLMLAEAGFRGGSLQLYQLSFARAGGRGWPWTRAAWCG